MNVLIAEKLIDQEYIAQWTVGFDQLAEHVKTLTLEWAAPITDLSADQIRESARVMGQRRPQAVIVPGRHVVWYGNDISYGTCLFHTLPNVPRTQEALKNLDLHVVVDVLPQDHVAWADVVLPEATYLERYDELWVCGHKMPYIALREPAVEPLYQTKPAWWMVRELGLRLGLED